MKPLVIATHNVKKAGEMMTILSAALPHRRLLTLADFPNAPEPEETGPSYEANALIKARSAVKVTGEECIADDAGLEVDALDGAPGVFSKRFGGEDLPFPKKIERMLKMLESVPEPQRSARFRCWVALVSPEGEEHTFEGICEGRIATEPKGENGFGYDPIFFLPELDRTMAQLTPSEKHAISHRGIVLGEVIAHLYPDAPALAGPIPPSERS